MEEEPATTPFWLPPSSGHRRRRSSRSPSSIFLSSRFLIVFLPLTALLFIVFVLPPIVSVTSYIFRPNMVKKSWDSLNLVLVLFAIICGFLSRGGGGGSSDMESSVLEAPEENTERSNHGHWYEERSGYGGLRRLRSSSSYPDLRQESAWAGSDGQWRSFDDSQLANRRVLDRRFYTRRRYDDRDYGEVKNIDVDNTSVISPKEKVLSHSPPRAPSPPPPPAPPPVVRRKVKRSYQAIAKEEKRETTENSGFECGRVQDAAPVTATVPPPPPPPPPPLTARKSDRKRGGATKEFLTSLYYQRNNKKKQRQKSMENLDAILHNSPPFDQPLRPRPSPPPPPPPPPPPNSVFHNLFSSKKGKSKRFLTVPPPPPPPPPPTRSYAGKSKTSIALSQSHPYDHPLTTSNPPVPDKSNNFNNSDGNPFAGSESPLIPIPPPPPPPPFKMPDWKFVVQGDYVRIKSTNSSRCGSPDLDCIGSPSNKGPSRSTSLKSETDGGDLAPPLFCPSPDVNTKADTFIARFRAGLKLEKINSIKEKQEVGLSNLGPESGQGNGSRALQI